MYISLLCCSFNTWWLIEGGEPYQRCIHVRCILTCFSVSLRCSYVVFFHHISLTCMRVLNHDTWEMTTRWKKCTLTVPRSLFFLVTKDLDDLDHDWNMNWLMLRCGLILDVTSPNQRGRWYDGRATLRNIEFLGASVPLPHHEAEGILKYNHNEHLGNIEADDLAIFFPIYLQVVGPKK